MNINKNTFNEFELVGKDLSNRGLISSHAGNISLRIDENIIITKSGSMAGWLTPDHLVIINIENSESEKEKSASTESIVHKAIYKNTGAKAIIHSHNPICTTLSFILNEIKCIDLEGMLFLGTIPVIECKNPTASPELAKKVSENLINNPVVVVKSHGVFATGTTLTDALKNITGAEQSAEIIYRLILLGKH